MHPKTRPWNLLTLLTTTFFWIIAGFWYGFGYCPLTDWHWLVREKLGFRDMPNSYVKFLVDSLTGWNVDATTVDILTAVLFALALVVSLTLNVRDWKRARKIPS